MRPPLAALVALALASSPTGAAAQGSAAAEPAWRDLFDGRTLNGWVRHGGTADFRVEAGAIVGSSIPGQPNSFLCTERTYGDFELELELRIDPRLNSGVQIRSEIGGTPTEDWVFGYQVEVDPSKRSWSGGIYDERRRGWLFDLADRPKARAAFDRDGWNRYRVRCVADRLQTWVNDVPAADLVDATTLRGVIALQVHGVGNDPDAAGREVRWRNLRLRDLGRHAWQPLWDGATLTGWRATPGGSWHVDDGVLIGSNPASDSRHGILLSESRYDDFTARIEYRAVQGNSGFYFRSEPVDGAVGVHGFQAEIDADPKQPNGGLYETGGRAWVRRPDGEPVLRTGGEWNTMVVSTLGERVAVTVNGRRTAWLVDAKGRRDGHFGVQLHGGQDMRVEVRAIELLVPQGEAGR